MVQKLSIQIGLEGGEELQRQLKDIGDAGQQAFLEISKAAQQVGGFTKLDPAVVTQQLETMGITGAEAIGKIEAAVATATRFERVVGALKTVEDGFQKLEKATDKFANRMARSFGPLGEFAKALGPVGIGMAALALGFVKAGLSASESINKVTESTSKLGVTIEQFDRLRQGFEQAGISSEAIVEGLGHVQTALVKTASAQLLDAALRGFGAQGTAQLRILEEAAKGTGEAATLARDALVKLGLPIEDGAAASLDKLAASGAKLSDVVPKIVERLRLMPDSMERTQQAVDLLGEKLGLELIAALRTGGVAIDQFNQKFTTLTREQQIAAEQQQQSINRLAAAWNRLILVTARPLAAVTVPALDWLSREMPRIQQGLETTSREFAALGRVLTSLGNAAAVAWNAPLQALRLLGTAIGNVIGWLGTLAANLAGNIWAAFANAGLTAWNAIIGAVQNAWNTITNFFATLAGDIWGGIRQAGIDAWAAIKQAASDASNAVAAFFTNLPTDIWEGMKTAGVAAWNAITAAINNTIAAVMKLVGMGGGGTGGIAPDTSGGGFAGGGLIGGRGTGTSDSNLAWVSRGEHIMPARSVGQPGVLAFLEALRRSGGDLRRVLDGLGRFALGGPVGMPALATGGVGGMSHVTIQFPGLSPISGLRASADVVEELRRSAAMAQVRSGGRKPSRYT